MRLPGSSIQTKVALATTLLVALISIFIYFYFPARLREQAARITADEAHVVSQMAALSVAPGLATGDLPDVYRALDAIRQNPDVAYIVVFERVGERPFAAYNPQLADYLRFRDVEMAPQEIPSSRGVERPRAFGGFVGQRIYQARVPVFDQGRHLGEIFLGMTTDRLNQEVEINKRMVTAVAIAIFAIGIFFAVAISRAIISPLRGMAETTKRIAGGNLGERAQVEGRDEVAQLARSFNTMLGRLEQAQGELAALNRTLEQRVEERTRELREEMTERRRAERRYRLLFERNLSGVYIAHLDGRVISCNDSAARMLGFESAEDLIQNKGTITYFDATDHQQVMEQLLEKGSAVNHEARLLRRDGDVIWVLETLTASTAEHEDTPLVEGIVLDITDRKRTEQEVEYQAYHDPLTGLPNRMLFLDRLTVALAHARRRHQPLAVMFLDLDDLKIVNDTLGHAAGDQLLQMVADRLSACLRQDDTVGRIGGDEFTLLVPDLNSADDATMVAEKVIKAIRQPFVIGDDDVRVTTSIGIAMYPTDGEDPETLLAHADGTMYRVKEGGGATYQFYSETMARKSLGRMSMEESLRHAVERDEIVVFYQPQVNARTREVVALEALVRWRHPEAGLIEPAGFISLAEYTGLIIPIGECVLREACRQTKEWHDLGMKHLRVGVNVSARQFHQRDFLGMIDRALGECGLPPSALELEITETMAMQKSERTISMLQRLRDRGIGIALDDFGTGQSSLTYLKRFPISTVKIDRSFVSGVSHAVLDAPIVEAILHLAASLGLRTVAEGIETGEQWEFLASRGCTEMQGYYVSRPMEAEKVVRFVGKSRV
ncbi:MAG TPA: EAL domain-containing protein [Thermoanaerobaculia bacterium]|nr:EAL domain-containing protein [Thermoanaerobaculia bacterium]